MYSATKILMWGMGISAAVLVAAGCQSKNNGTDHTMQHGDHMMGGATTQQADAVTCSKCKVTWVREPVTTGGGKEHVVSYQTRQSMECPDCRTAVDHFFRTGKLEHSCKTCGDQLEVCEAH